MFLNLTLCCKSRYPGNYSCSGQTEGNQPSYCALRQGESLQHHGAYTAFRVSGHSGTTWACWCQAVCKHLLQQKPSPSALSECPQQLLSLAWQKCGSELLLCKNALLDYWVPKELKVVTVPTWRETQPGLPWLLRSLRLKITQYCQVLFLFQGISLFKHFEPSSKCDVCIKHVSHLPESWHIWDRILVNSIN